MTPPFLMPFFFFLRFLFQTRAGAIESAPEGTIRTKTSRLPMKGGMSFARQQLLQKEGVVRLYTFYRVINQKGDFY